VHILLARYPFPPRASEFNNVFITQVKYLSLTIQSMSILNSDPVCGRLNFAENTHFGAN
jgi:hypothetical protein